jgi:hypothetical protein
MAAGFLELSPALVPLVQSFLKFAVVTSDTNEVETREAYIIEAPKMFSGKRAG